MSEPTARCQGCGAPREVPVEGECPKCGSPNVAICDSDAGAAHEFVALKARDDPSEREPGLTCKACGAELDESARAPVEERKPCLNCGSLEGHFALTLEARGAIGSNLGLKARRGGRGKPFMELKQGENFSPIRDRFMHLLQIVDRRNNRYRKLVTDPETGEIVRDVDEPLSEHVGRGDARSPALDLHTPKPSNPSGL
jgi:hypothetical protein